MKFMLVLACIAAASADVSHIAHDNTHYLPPTTAKPFTGYAPAATPAPFAPVAPVLPSISTYSSYGQLPAVASISPTAAPAYSSFESLPAVGPTFAPFVQTATAAPVHASFQAAPVHASFQAAPVHASFQAAPVHASFQAAPVHASFPAASASFVTAPKLSAPVSPSAVSTTSYVSAPKSTGPLAAPLPYTTYSYPSTFSGYPSTYGSYPSTYGSYPSTYSSYPSTIGSYPAYTTSGVLGSNYQYPSAPIYTQPISTAPDYSSYYSGFDSIYGGLTSSSLYAPSTDAAVVDAKIAAPNAPLKPVFAYPTTTPAPAPATTPAPIFKPINRAEEIAAASYSDNDGYVYKTPEH